MLSSNLAGCIEARRSVLPPVINERDIFPFKFWFSDSIQDGMYYRNELYYRLQSVTVTHRAKLYHYACKLAQSHPVIVTTRADECSVWISLRGKEANDWVSHHNGLPSFEDFLSKKSSSISESESISESSSISESESLSVSESVSEG